MKAQHLTYGIEIECLVPNEYRNMFTIGGYHQTDGGVTGFPAGWNAQRDGSLVETAGFFAVEVVSPVLSGEEGLRQVAEVLNILETWGTISNASTGIHVHIGMSGIDLVTMRKIKTAFKRYEMAFFALNGQQMSVRLGSRYCKPSNLWDRTRYNSLNTTNYGRNSKNTLEIRCLTSKIESAFAVTAIYMATALVARVTETGIRCLSSQLDATTAARRFIRDHFEATNSADYCIVPDESPADVADYIAAQIAEATGGSDD